MQFADILTLDAPKRTKDGYLAVRAKAARTGYYDYAGHEIDPENKHGLRDAAIVKVLRDTETVFDPRSAHSFIGKPITDDHPSEAVTSENWRDHARGVVMGAKWEEGGYLAFDLMLTDAATIAKVEDGKRELSNGYSAELQFGDFTAPDGTKCQAKQVSVVGNHVAIVAKGRAGPTCRISDGGNGFPPCKSNPQAIDHLKGKRSMNFIMLDGLKVDLDDGDAVKIAVTKLEAKVADATTAKDAAETKVATLTTEKATLDAKIVTLEQQVKDSAITPAKLRDAAKVYADTAAKAKALGVTVTDEMGEADIQKAVVTAKLGDAAKDWTPEMVSVSFATMTADTKIEPKHDPIHAPKAMTTDNASVRDFVRAAQY